VKFHRLLITLTLAFCLSSAAGAQVCEESGSGSGNDNNAALGCDMKQRDLVVDCKSHNTDASCPSKPMPMFENKLKSYIKDYSTQLYNYLQDPKDQNLPYDGTYYRGTPGNKDLAQKEFGNVEPGTTRLSTCTPQVKLASEAKTPEDRAKLIRLQLDNCANQYILNEAIYPFQKADPKLLSGEDENDAAALISPATECQSLNTAPVPEEEYLASDYMKTAWTKLLNDPKHIRTPDAPLEPKMPDGLKLENTDRAGPKMPDDFPEVKLASLAVSKYEEINDPSHPYTPRWDFKWNERDKYSPSTKEYGDDPENGVYCAGAKKDGGSGSSSGGGGNQQTDKVKVDILIFREEKLEFDKKITKRIAYNTACDKNDGNQKGPCCKPEPGKPPKCVIQSCKTCFAFSAESPTCSTDYLNQPDRKDVDSQYIPLDLAARGKEPGTRILLSEAYANMGPVTARCDPDEQEANDVPMALLCKELRRPLVMVNKLKMRYHNPDKPEMMALPAGVPEGLTFKEYFTDHMPYPRLWDTGTSIQKDKPSDVKFQEPMDYEGQYTAIVGVGREAKLDSGNGSGSASSSGSNGDSGNSGGGADERCLAGGWGGDVSFGGISIKTPDPITSWTELKLYQSRTLRNKRVSCIGRYEKVFKPGSTENMVLAAAGGEIPVIIVSSCPKNNSDPAACTYKSLKEYKDAGSANAGQSNMVTITKYKQVGVPLGWRGYLASKNDATRFPKFGGAKGTTITGLSKADLGDIVLFPKGSGPDNGKPGLPKIGLVRETNINGDCEKQKNCYVQVFEADNGKWPDTCGSTDNWGEMKTRYLYKPGFMPTNMVDSLNLLKSNRNCEDTKLSHCELSTWDSIELYRVTDDVLKATEQ